MRLLRGEDLETVSRELGVTAARVSQWRDQFMAGGEANLKSREPDVREEANQRLQAKIGELLMENELLYAKVDELEAGSPLARRRSKR
jgi:transposase-like protein